MRTIWIVTENHPHYSDSLNHHAVETRELADAFLRKFSQQNWVRYSRPVEADFWEEKDIQESAE